MVEGIGYKTLLNDDLKPGLTEQDLAGNGISHDLHLPPDTNIKLLSLESGNGQEFWLGFDNFYVITRYNHSPLYAMAVFQLAREIRIAFEGEIVSEG